MTTPIADLVEQMLAAGVPHDTIVLAVRTAEIAVACAARPVDIPVDMAAEKRRAYDRERKRLKREPGGHSGGIPVDAKDACVHRKSGGIPVEIPPDTENASLSKKEERNLEKRERGRGTRLPPDWRPSAKNIEEAKAEGLTDRDIERASKRFPDYWRQQPGQKGVKLDWDATWRNWCSREAEKLGREPPGSAPAGGTGFYAAADSRELEEWDRYKFETEGRKCARDRNGGWRVPSRWPPGHEPSASSELHPTASQAAPPIQ